MTRDANAETLNRVTGETQASRKHPKRPARFVAHFFVSGLLAISLTLSACTGRVNVRGNKPDPDILSEIIEEKYSRAEVEQLIGTPSSVAVFSNETWLYISKTTETWAFLEPEVLEQTVVVIQFDDNDQVASVDTLGIEDGRIVSLNENATPTLGNDLSAIEQLLNNMGRFNKE